MLGIVRRVGGRSFNSLPGLSRAASLQCTTHGGWEVQEEEGGARGGRSGLQEEEGGREECEVWQAVPGPVRPVTGQVLRPTTVTDGTGSPGRPRRGLAHPRPPVGRAAPIPGRPLAAGRRRPLWILILGEPAAAAAPAHPPVSSSGALQSWPGHPPPNGCLPSPASPATCQ